jgi:hypothetical protein
LLSDEGSLEAFAEALPRKRGRPTKIELAARSNSAAIAERDRHLETAWQLPLEERSPAQPQLTSRAPVMPSPKRGRKKNESPVAQAERNLAIALAQALHAAREKHHRRRLPWPQKAGYGDPDRRDIIPKPIDEFIRATIPSAVEIFGVDQTQLSIDRIFRLATKSMTIRSLKYMKKVKL